MAEGKRIPDGITLLFGLTSEQSKKQKGKKSTLSPSIILRTPVCLTDECQSELQKIPHVIFQEGSLVVPSGELVPFHQTLSISETEAFIAQNKGYRLEFFANSILVTLMSGRHAEQEAALTGVMVSFVGGGNPLLPVLLPQVGHVLSSTCQINVGPNWMYPDVAWLSTATRALIPQVVWNTNRLPVLPEVVIEIRSVSNNWTSQDIKMVTWVTAGVQVLL